MVAEYSPGVKAGLISGVIWAALMSVVGLASVEVSYTSTFSYYNGLFARNSSTFGGMTAGQYINYLLELNALITFVLALAFGALIGFLFVIITPRFLENRSLTVKGVLVAIFFWLLYELAIGSSDVVSVVSSLLVSLFCGYLLGFLYQRYGGLSRKKLLGSPEPSSRRDPNRPPPHRGGKLQP
jgi:lipopolysaccharide export LptBFGC system permease protein LptF